MLIVAKNEEESAYLNSLGERLSQELGELDDQINSAVERSEQLQAEAEGTSDPEEVARLEREVHEIELQILALRDDFNSLASQLPTF